MNTFHKDTFIIQIIINTIMLETTEVFSKFKVKTPSPPDSN